MHDCTLYVPGHKVRDDAIQNVILSMFSNDKPDRTQDMEGWVTKCAAKIRSPPQKKRIRHQRATSARANGLETPCSRRRRQLENCRRRDLWHEMRGLKRENNTYTRVEFHTSQTKAFNTRVSAFLKTICLVYLFLPPHPPSAPPSSITAYTLLKLLLSWALANKWLTLGTFPFDKNIFRQTVLPIINIKCFAPCECDSRVFDWWGLQDVTYRVWFVNPGYQSCRRMCSQQTWLDSAPHTLKRHQQPPMMLAAANNSSSRLQITDVLSLIYLAPPV